MALPLHYSLKSLWLRRSTAVAAAAGIALVVFVLAASLMLAEGLRQTHGRAGRTDRVLVTQQDSYSESGSRLRQSVKTLVAAVPGVQAGPGGQPLVTAETVVHVYLQKTGDPERLASVQVRGVSPNVLDLRPEVTIVAGRAAKPGSQEGLVGKALFGEYDGLELGQGIELQKNRRVEIVGVFEAGGSAHESEVWTDVEFVKSAFGYEGFVSSITARLTSADALPDFQRDLGLKVQQGLSIEPEGRYYARVSNYLSNSLSALGTVVTFIFCFGAMLGAAITLFGAVSQRSREIGVLRALGFRGADVLLAILVETTALSLAGGLLGIAGALLTPFIHFSTVNWATGQEIVFGFFPTWGILLLALIAGTVVGVLGGFFPALRAARITPLQAMRQ